jgi:hypothetical protein
MKSVLQTNPTQPAEKGCRVLQRTDGRTSEVYDERWETSVVVTHKGRGFEGALGLGCVYTAEGHRTIRTSFKCIRPMFTG